MAVVVNSSIKKKFIEHFSGYKEAGYEDLIEFFGNQVGFSVKKSHGKDIEEITLLKVALIDDADAKANVFVDATYGKLSENSQGLIIRNSDEIKLNDPIDIREVGDLSYDADSNTLLRSGQKVSGIDVLNYVYEKHIKPTRKYGGLLLRLKLWYWRKALKNILKATSNVLTFILIVVAGIKYRYDAFFGEELVDSLEPKLNTKVTKIPETKPINFFGYEVNKWTIVFYCLLHLGLFFTFYFFSWHANYVSKIFTNNFLTAIYVVVSLWLLEYVVPLLLMNLIKKLSTVVIGLEFKKIEI